MMDQTARRQVIRWLLTGCFLIFLMVIIGGITRLTHSGLSMVEWDLIMGTFPPMSEGAWEEAFDKYKQFPEYQLVNYHFTLEEFKSIFWWEYIHRLLGRLIGLVFLIPFVVFWSRKVLSGKLKLKLLFILFLGGLQGFFGWYMVKSGLSREPDVSHYRLALHLITAFLTFGYTFWVALGLFYEKFDTMPGRFTVLKRYMWAFFLLVVVQVIYGAFVAGLNAGFVFNTFPKMGNEWIAEAVTAIEPWYLNFVEGIAGVQFVHRYIAILLVVLMGVMFYKSRKLHLLFSQQLAMRLLVLALSTQFVLGVFTLVYAVPILLGILHQAGAFVLFACSIFALHRFSRAAA